ncbi:MAG: type III-A CRISPR-associated protein Csm2 [Cryomorphaceae bacterium]|nr:type III-A CRISPR-associated protein Csm2 [Cryomorphaceae bacterium]
MNLRIEKQWITDSLPESALSQISEFSKTLTEDKRNRDFGSLKSSQIRKFYGEVKRIQTHGIEKNKMAFKMLKPKLAYAVGRQKGADQTKINSFYQVISQAMDAVEIDNTSSPEELNFRFKNFVNLFEAIVAYHKYHGGE